MDEHRFRSAEDKWPKRYWIATCVCGEDRRGDTEEQARRTLSDHIWLENHDAARARMTR